MTALACGAEVYLYASCIFELFIHRARDYHEIRCPYLYAEFRWP